MGNNGDVREVPIKDIVRDEKVQPRFKMDQATVRRYAKAYKAGVDMPPIQLAQVGNVKILFDGWHRVAALERNGEAMVKATVIKAKRKELPWLAAQANVAHGKPLKRGEIKEMFHPYMQAERYLGEDGKAKSYREIAKELGGTHGHTTVRKWMLASYRRIANQYYSREVEEHISGNPRPSVEPEASFMGDALEALSTALMLFKGIESPVERGELILRTKDVLQEMKTDDRGYEEPPF
ncbi:MAG: hypothetical protein ACLP2X_11530 [Syntrophobacteraceae bacterium]